MNRPRDKSLSTVVRTRIEHGGPDRLWTFPDFKDLDSPLAVAAALSRLSRAGFIQRVRRGVYYRSKPTVFGETKPQAEAVVEAVAKRNGVNTMPGGPAFYNRLGLTDQVSGAVTVAADRPLALRTVQGVPVKAVVRPLRLQAGIRSDERVVLDVLRQPDGVPGASVADVLQRIKSLLKNRQLDLKRLVRFAGPEPPRVRAILGAIGDDLGRRNDVASLRGRLHPLTSYRVRGDIPLVHASEWRIRRVAV